MKIILRKEHPGSGLWITYNTGRRYQVHLYESGSSRFPAYKLKTYPEAEKFLFAYMEGQKSKRTSHLWGKK
jgi:hypothetical protein